jgi:hypothetical protein
MGIDTFLTLRRELVFLPLALAIPLLEILLPEFPKILEPSQC